MKGSPYAVERRSGEYYGVGEEDEGESRRGKFYGGDFLGGRARIFIKNCKLQATRRKERMESPPPLRMRTTAPPGRIPWLWSLRCEGVLPGGKGGDVEKQRGMRRQRGAAVGIRCDVPY